MTARHDALGAPARELSGARLGTAYFLRKLNELPDDEYDRASLLPLWRRRELIAHVGYNARALTRLTTWAATGVETPMYSSAAQRDEEIRLGATLSPHALRSLVYHSAVHLNVEWRDLTDGAWTCAVRTALGREVAASETPWMRAREVWVHAVDLNNGAGFADFPADLIDSIIFDVVTNWRRRGEQADLVLAPTDRADPMVVGAGGPARIIATAAEIARWLTGRGASAQLSARLPVLPHLPRWVLTTTSVQGPDRLFSSP